MNQVLKRLAELPPKKRAIVISRLPPLSFAQQRLWFIDQLEGGSAFYNLHAALRLRGQLNVSALEQTFGEITRRHEILRTIFVAVDGHPVQLIQPDCAVMLPSIDLSQIDNAEREAEAERLAREEAQRPFDLATGPLLCVTLLKLADDEHIILLTMHHIVSDGWSIGILVREVAALYRPLQTDANQHLRPHSQLL